MTSKVKTKAIWDLDKYINVMKKQFIQPESITVSKLQYQALVEMIGAQDGQGITEYGGYKIKIYED